MDNDARDRKRQAEYLLVLDRPASTASSAHALRLALGRCRRGERVTVFLTENVFPSDRLVLSPVPSPNVGGGVGVGAVHLLQQLLLSGGQVLACDAILGNGSPMGHIPGVERGTEDDVATLLRTPGIDALWC